MKLLQHISRYRFLPGRAVVPLAGVLLAGMLLLPACATQRPIHAKPPPLLNSGPEIQVADVDVLAVTPAMQAFLERYILPYDNLDTRLRLLTLAVASTGVLGFDYDEARTLTAAEAFRTRSGNCIGFTNMMIALVRAAGLQADYQEVIRRPEWTRREDTLLLVKHVNVVVSSPRYNYVVDISSVKFKTNAPPRIISDSYAKALYFNNIGAEALLRNELPMAWAYLVTAINTEPGLTDPWVNLGVVYSRNEQLDEAELVYQTALHIDASEYSAMNNLYEVYLLREDQEAAQSLWTRVERYRKRNPYYLMYLSEESLGLGRFEESISLLQRAIKIKDDGYLLYFALAKTQYLSGDTAAAQISLDRTRELAPQGLLEFYSRPLKELVMEE